MKHHPAENDAEDDSAPDSEPAALKAALDELYGSSPDEFVAQRKRLSATFKAGGDKDLAKRVEAARRPNRVAATLNHLALSHAPVVRALLQAFDLATVAQSKSDANAWRKALATYREKLAAASQTVREMLADEGVAPDPALLRQVNESLQAAASNPPRRTFLLAARLDKGIDAEDSLLGFGAPPVPEARAVADETKEPPEKDAKPKKAAPKHATAESESAERARREREKEHARAKEREAQAAAEKERERAAAAAKKEQARLLAEAQRRVKDLEAKKTAADEDSARAEASLRDAERDARSAAEKAKRIASELDEALDALRKQTRVAKSK